MILKRRTEMAALLVKMECLTNMHVGNGDVNYSIIDKEVERDDNTGHPIVNASGVKGALREYFENNAELKIYADAFFGKGGEKGETKPGSLKILSAEMMAMPFRASVGTRAFYLVTDDSALARYEEIRASLFPKMKKMNITDADDANAVEGISLKRTITFGDDKIYVLSDSDFRDLKLPVLARNKLDNGISSNLWYEEVVPHESIFYFSVISNYASGNTSAQSDLKKFAKDIEGRIVQFGGNATIGYGLCRLTVIGENDE